MYGDFLYWVVFKKTDQLILLSTKAKSFIRNQNAIWHFSGMLVVSYSTRIHGVTFRLYRHRQQNLKPQGMFSVGINWNEILSVPFILNIPVKFKSPTSSLGQPLPIVRSFCDKCTKVSQLAVCSLSTHLGRDLLALLHVTGATPRADDSWVAYRVGYWRGLHPLCFPSL